MLHHQTNRRLWLALIATLWVPGALAQAPPADAPPKDAAAPKDALPKDALPSKDTPPKDAGAPKDGAPPPNPANMPSVTIGGPSAASTEAAAPADASLHVNSLFFTTEEMNSLHRATAVYTNLTTGKDTEKGNEAAAFLKQLEQGGKKKEDEQMPVVERFYAYPQFYMESLTYHSADDWNIRINNELLNKDVRQTKDGLRVMNVDNDKALLQWTPKNMQKIKEIWDAAPNNAVSVDFAQGLVVFSLHANQTFASFVMRVLEGKVKPVVVDTMPVGGAAKLAATAKSDTPAPAPDGASAGSGDNKDGSKEGLSGLIGKYQDLKKDQIK